MRIFVETLHADGVERGGGCPAGCGPAGDGNVRINCDRHAKSALRHADDLSSSVFDDLYGPVMGRGTLVGLDGDAHRRLRAAVASLFSARTVATAYRPLVESRVRAVVAEMLDRGQRNGDLVAEVAGRVPSESLALLLGLETEEGGRLSGWARSVIRFYEDPRRSVEAAYELRRFLLELVRRRTMVPKGDLISSLLGVEAGGALLGEQEVVRFLRLLVPAGIETTSVGLANVLFALLQHGEVLGTAVGGAQAIPALVEEALRWAPPVRWVVRRGQAAATVADVEVEAGGVILVSLADANHDDSRYLDATRFMAGRRKGSGVSFGFGPHRCLGVALAREELSCTIRELYRRAPTLRLAEGSGERGPKGDVIYGLESMPVIW